MKLKIESKARMFSLVDELSKFPHPFSVIGKDAPPLGPPTYWVVEYDPALEGTVMKALSPFADAAYREFATQWAHSGQREMAALAELITQYPNPQELHRTLQSLYEALGSLTEKAWAREVP